MGVRQNTVERFSRRPALIWLCVAALVLLLVVVLRLEGRVWWCACRTPTPFSTDVHSRHNSQHLLDAYSFSHLLHGVIFFGLLWLARRRMPLGWRFVLAIGIEVAWECLENSPIVIQRYRAATAAVGYAGDSVVNSFGDVLSCAAGFWLARRLGFWWSAALFVVVELAMLATIRDNLTLNIVMLFFPSDAIRRWQSGS